MRRCLPDILSGKVVILTGHGFRGYDDGEKGFETHLQPFSNYDEKGISKEVYLNLIITQEQYEANYKYPPASLLNKDHNWWLCILCNYFLRPKENVMSRIRRIRQNLPSNYIGLHIRRGDHPRGLKYTHEDYLKIVRHKIIPLWREHFKDREPVIFLCTDDPNTISQLIEDCEYKIVTQGSLISHQISHPGESASNVVIANDHQGWSLEVGEEVYTDLFMLSRSNFICGFMLSQVTIVASMISMANNNLITNPFAVDLTDHIDIPPDSGYVIKFQ
jgi:hypothetical protein